MVIGVDVVPDGFAFVFRVRCLVIFVSFREAGSRAGFELIEGS